MVVIPAIFQVAPQAQGGPRPDLVRLSTVFALVMRGRDNNEENSPLTAYTDCGLIFRRAP